MDSTMVPHLAYIVDQRYSADYATVYGLSQISVCFAYGVAPLIGSQLTQLVGFQWLMSALGFLNILYSIVIAWLQTRQCLTNEPKQINCNLPSNLTPATCIAFDSVKLFLLSMLILCFV